VVPGPYSSEQLSQIGGFGRLARDMTVDARLLNQRFPGAATWLELHSGLAGAGLVLILLVAGAIVWAVVAR
jgi:hypothetical protein